MVDWSHPSIADNSWVVNRGLSSIRTFNRSISDSRGRPDLGRFSNDMSPSRKLLNQSQHVRSATAPSPSAAHILRAAALALFPDWNS
ncbi:unnamed protein product [Rotaria sp. Silwood1]|nr:unnamed protein product [Rotaria sp. Silwood1]